MINSSQWKLEVCVGSVEGVAAATRAGADRVELCANLIEGGTTPSSGMMKLAREVTTIPIMTMIRPRGGDFCYTEAELEVMRADIDHARESGSSGIVLGALSTDGTIDLISTQELMERASPLPVTFHRAFDMTPDPFVALDQLIDLGVTRVLTSGQEASAEKGIPLLKELVDKAEDKIIILPGGGIREQSIRSILESTGAVEAHFSASVRSKSPMTHRNSRVFMGSPSPPGEYERTRTDEARVRAFKAALQN